MITQEKQILSFLQAFDKEFVLQAFDLYKIGLDNSFQEAEENFKKQGWHPVTNKPTDREVFSFNGKYWVQTEEARSKDIEEKRKKLKKTTDNKTSMDLKKSKMKCPICGGHMYKQAVCPGCKEGKAGYKIRLICEDNTDHEILL